MTVRIQPNVCLPPFRWWLWAVLVEPDGREWRLAVLKLPSYQLRYWPLRCRDEWHQLALVYHGDCGFSFEWLLTDRESDSHG